MIYMFNRNEKISIMAIGDGISSGETSYNIDGISYNDYLKEYFENKRLLKNYNNSFTMKNYNITNLLYDIKNNVKKNNKLNIKQLIHNADIVTIAIGEEELIKAVMTKDLKEEYLKEFIYKYDKLILSLKEITEAKIFIVGFYENEYLSKRNVIILNANLRNIALKYDLVFIDISDLLINKGYFLNKKDYYFNYKAHEEIAKMIINSL